jgi:uncharacterized protein (DUF302 family)
VALGEAPFAVTHLLRHVDETTGEVAMNGSSTGEAKADATMRTVRSAFDADQTVRRIEEAAVAGGMKVFARIDQAAEARAAGLAMRPLVLILFGNPKGGTPLMVARPTTGIDLPLKAIVWSDEAGSTWVTYNTAQLLVQRHGLDPQLAAKLAPAEAMIDKAVR